MANEIKLQAALSLTNGNLESPKINFNVEADQATARIYEDTQNIATTAGGEVLAKGSISTAGWCIFRNLDPTNYVKVGPESGGAIVDLIKILPGETAGPFQLATGTVRAIADTGAVDLWYRIFEA